jgi:alpha-beta hydrolase superfamily lysophospholipase
MKKKSNSKAYKLSSTNDTLIDFTIYSEKENIDKLLLITHGYGEHKEYYREFAEYFVKKGYAVCTYDLRSHGKSGGKRGHVQLFDLFLDDIDKIIDVIRDIFGMIPIFLFGHSMGGSIVLNYLYKRESKHIEKVVISSPWLKLAFEPPKFKLFLAKVGNLLFPSIPLKGELDTKNLSRDIGFIQRFEKDPDTYDKISPKYFFEIRNAGLFVLENKTKIQTPILLTHGSDDNITSLEASKEFCNSVGDICTFKEWKGYKHVVFSENDKDSIFEYYYNYLEK